ncbi:MAG: excinuclease ABC subunit UvrC [Elusimicrobia bacterium]|nr:excinuclease ABC subunit UvrC [Elusimicrobiota bacterium]
MAEEPVDRTHLPHGCGVYLMRDTAASIIYIGKAKDLAKRVSQYFHPSKQFKSSVMAPLVRRIDYIACASEREALLLERRLIGLHQPFFNSMWKDNKTYPWVKITMGEDFPRIGLCRRKLKDGGAYFGPYPKVAPVKSLLGTLWRRRIFRLRPCRWDFSAGKPLDPRKVRSCLYYHTQECPAPCAGKISLGDYRRIAEDAVLFFRGDYPRLKERFEAEMRKASAETRFEDAASFRDSLQALLQMDERVRVQAVEAADIEKPIADSRAVSDLKLALGLAKPPAHIECFDISHWQGRQTVASMVCFMGGEPHHAHYRRFRLREVRGVDDFKSMEEAVRRRYGRLQRAGEPLPDLVLVDGGKGQLSSAAAAVGSLDLKVPLAALAKRTEEVFLPGRPGPIILDRARPALRLLQRLRDEAHRFGLRYHTLLRGKALFGEDKEAS